MFYLPCQKPTKEWPWEKKLQYSKAGASPVFPGDPSREHC